MNNTGGTPDGGRRDRPRSDARRRQVPQSWVVSAILGAAIMVGLAVLQFTGALAVLGDDVAAGAIPWIAVIAGILVITVSFAWERQGG